MSKFQRFYPGFTFALVVVVAIGIFFRVSHLDTKVFWHDEVFTTFRVLGYTGEEAEQTLYTGEVLTPEQILQFQTPDPERGWDDTLTALKTHPEHPPLYYGLARLWVDAFGSSVAAIRSLSVAIALLTFPLLYWLCIELFESPLVGWVAIALFSISPFHVLYAQEARQYSLWTLTTVLASGVLLRALRLKSVAAWIGYAIAVSLGLYTSLFSVLVYLAHGLYVVVLERFRFSKTILSFGLALAAGLATFAPWMRVMVDNWSEFQSKTEWTQYAQPVSALAKLWGLHLSSLIIDWGLPLEHPYTYLVPPLVLLLVGFACFILARQTPLPIWLFVVLLTVIPAIALILPDLLLGGQRSASTRYFVPSLVGALLAIAYLLAHLLTHPIWVKQRMGQWLAALLLTVGIISCALSWQSNTWWSKGVSYGIPRTAELLNDLPQPLVIMSLRDVSLGNAISLSYWLEDSVRFQLVREPEIPDMPEDVSDRLLMHPTEALIQAFNDSPQFTVVSLNRDNVFSIVETNPDTQAE